MTEESVAVAAGVASNIAKLPAKLLGAGER